MKKRKERKKKELRKERKRVIGMNKRKEMRQRGEGMNTGATKTGMDGEGMKGKK